MDFFVGLWPIISHFTIGLVITGACIAVALLSAEIQAIPIVGPLLAPMARQIRMWAIVIAVGSAVGLVGYSMGIKNEAQRCKLQINQAKETAIANGNHARTRAVRDAAGGVRDPQDSDSD